jgi:hypothetical protein
MGAVTGMVISSPFRALVACADDRATTIGSEGLPSRNVRMASASHPAT